MIKIEERECKHFAGLTSIYIPVSYNKQINDTIKTVDEYFFHEEEMEWEIPTSKVDEILDSLTFLDDININLYEDKELKREQRDLSLTYKLKPFPYQEEGIRYGLNHDRWLLLDQMGLGKTFQIIHIAEELKARNLIEHCFIVCGINTLKSNWKNEIKIHSNESAIILGEKKKRDGSISIIPLSVEERANQLKNKIDEFFIICNIENFRNESFVKAFKKSSNRIDMIVVDEAHVIKNPQSSQAKGLIKCTAQYMIAATGTLILNDPTDTYMSLRWIGKEKTSFTNFKNYYCEFSPYIRGAITGFKNLDVLKEEIASCSLRRTKDILNLPEKTIINELVDMNEDQTKFYEDVKKGIKDQVDKVELSTDMLLSMISRLRQVTACPTFLTSQDIKSSKLERAKSLIDEILANNEKVVVMSSFIESIKLLETYLKGYPYLVCDGETLPCDIDRNKELFQNNPDYKILLCTWQKMGTGHTLNAASYMIHIDTAWTFGKFDQTCDRIHRIGTKKPVFIYNLICKNTIDERVVQLLEDKKALSDYMVDDKIEDENALNSLRQYITEEL